ncbi:LysR family transcriptional regulator [Cupriavidus plantarum]|uniref:LysR family transcriptional regulator n=1 Tax=Cupriavidus plantarum TaxID=942865 RepID=UPI0015C7D68D|nr:LysR family transcriptional regulator [Cupriavidus plantarum]NYI00135.1 DNA-binding transcriptional LysR family regulator [Cupriavidus plantarum]
MDLKDVDLNLLLVFSELLKQRRASRVAETLGISQPGVSNALNRLRKLLGDELFLRTSRGMEPTPYAQQLAEPISYALSTIHSTLNQQVKFDPMTSKRAFTIAMTDIGEIYILPTLTGLLERIAPGVTISTVRNATVNLRDEMEAGRVDLAVGWIPDMKTGFMQRRILRHSYVCLFRKGHALDKGTLTREEFCAAKHVVVVSAGSGHGVADETMKRSGVERDIRLVVPHFVAVGHILHETDLVATVPERFAERCAEPFGLSYVPCPVPLPEIAINLFWHTKYQRDPGNRWLRELLFETFSE